MEFIEIGSIKVIEYIGEVIDLTVEDDESYNIEGIVVHNSACTTWPTTGFGSRNCQASVIKDCSGFKVRRNDVYVDVLIIADGGIRCPADIAKSLVLGATMVMVGGLLSGFEDSPGNLININGVKKKEFWGSASSFQSNKKNRIEGTKYLIDYKDRSILDEMVYLQECLQSSISYGGGDNLKSLKDVNWQ